MLRGAYPITLDGKGRLPLPARVRAQGLGSDWVLTLDLYEPCIVGYPMTVWEPLEKHLMDLPNADREVRALQRLVVGHATPVTLDAQGRFLIPPVLCENAQLSHEVMWVGLGKKFELWDSVVWKHQTQVAQTQLSQFKGEVWNGLKF